MYDLKNVDVALNLEVFILENSKDKDLQVELKHKNIKEMDS